MEWCTDAGGNPYPCDCTDPNAPDFPCGSSVDNPGAGSVPGYGGDPSNNQQLGTGMGIGLQSCDRDCEPCGSLFTYTSCLASCLSGGTVGSFCQKTPPLVACGDLIPCPSVTSIVIVGAVVIGVLVAAQRAGL